MNYILFLLFTFLINTASFSQLKIAGGELEFR